MKWTLQLIEALHHMHTRKPPIIHGDIKVERYQTSLD